MDSEEGVFTGGDNGPILTPGSSRQSEIVRRLRLRRGHDEAMPPEGQAMTKAEIETIALWIDQGAYWSEANLKIFREAPLVLKKPEVPSSNYDHPIDAWVDAYFRKVNIKWPTTIDDHRFIRRAYLDAIGLLPSPENVTAFVNDPSPDKRIRLIDSLLSNDRDYAIHWLSFWNDLLRNDHTGTGYITNGRKRITDWLYRALLDNKSYDQFVRELIDPDSESEGFIKGIKWRGAVNASQTTELQAAQNISQSLLGLNLKCASCHNSFINNVTLQQAYDFAQVFADSTLELYRCDKPTGKNAKPAFLFPELGEVAGDGVKERLGALADIMTKEDNGRLYRTVVNRYWARFFWSWNH